MAYDDPPQVPDHFSVHVDVEIVPKTEYLAHAELTDMRKTNPDGRYRTVTAVGVGISAEAAQKEALLKALAMLADTPPDQQL